MPADSNATWYVWLMEGVDESKAIVRWVFIPDGGEIVSSMTFGRLFLQTRDMQPELMADAGPDEGWETFHDAEPFDLTLPWVIAQGHARRQGFPVEYPKGGTPPGEKPKVRSDPDLPPPTSMMTEQTG